MMLLKPYREVPRGAALKRLHLDALHFSGLAAMLRPLRGSGVIFYGHRVRPADDRPFQPNRGLECTPGFLAQVLERLGELGIPVVSLDDGMRQLRANDGAPFVCFTFDDGYRDNHDFAFPVFARFGVPFTIFLTTGFLDRTATMWWAAIEESVASSSSLRLRLDGGKIVLSCRSAREKRRAFVGLLRLFLPAPAPLREEWVRQLADQHPEGLASCRELALSWDMVRRMAASGRVAFGCHTVTHPMLSRLSESEFRREIDGCCARFEQETGQRPAFAAYPYGDAAAAGEREFQLAGRHGFTGVVTTREHALTARSLRQPMAIPRMALDGYLQKLRYVERCLPRPHGTGGNGGL